MESSTDSSEPATQPATLELGQSANWGGVGQPTPDTSPESISTVPSNRKQPSVRLGGRKSVGLVTTSTISSEPPSTESVKDNTDTCSEHSIHSELDKVIADDIIGRYSHHSIHSEASEEASDRAGLPATLVPYPDKKENHSSISATGILNSVISFFNLAKYRNSRADAARVQGAINLIKSLPTIRRVHVKNPTRTLTLRQYELLLPFLREVEKNKYLDNKLRYVILLYIRDSTYYDRFDYTRSARQFEIRMTTPLHEGMVAVFLEHYFLWKDRLLQSTSPTISDAARTLRSHGNSHVSFPVPKGPKSTKSPDGGIKHSCSLSCVVPTLIFETSFTNGNRQELRDKAETYIVGSEGKIRTVVAVYMGEMETAERKNEARLRKKYRAGRLDENDNFSYPDENGQYDYKQDEENKTDGASIMVWRAKIKNNRVTIGRVQETKIRDRTGNAIPSARLRISLKDCVCDSIMNSVKGSEAPLLETSSEAFCGIIQEELANYRMERAEVLRDLEIKKKEGTNKKKNYYYLLLLLLLFIIII
ncbi:hypothetical protein F5B18DRAFT_399195 [Nemania serpens]|nr:hypothetical protein F5B18DRAFT_399195 [Nemania serpens]